MYNNTTSIKRFPDSFNSDEDKSSSERVAIAFLTSIIVAVLSPIAVAGNALILAAIWKKTFARTPFHILLSGLAFTDLCTGLIAQPFYAATTFMYLVNRRVTYDTFKVTVIINNICECAAIYFISLTVLLITLMSVERWLHMSRRSLVTSRRGFLTVIIMLLIPIPTVAFQLHRRGRAVNILIITLLLSCYLITSLACFKVYRIIRLHQQQVRANETSQNFGQPAINLVKYKKSVASLLYIILIFSLCFLPYIVYILLLLCYGFGSDFIYAVDRVCMVLLFLSSALNPGLYIWRMNDIRNGVKQLLCTDG